jgi:hypothetical protein
MKLASIVVALVLAAAFGASAALADADGIGRLGTWMASNDPGQAPVGPLRTEGPDGYQPEVPAAVLRTARPDGYQPQLRTPVVVATAPRADGIHWTDAVFGAAVATALMLAIAGTTIVVRGRVAHP